MSTEQLGSLGLKTLTQDFPIIQVPLHSSENQFPPLQWQETQFKVMIERFTTLDAWLAQQIRLSRYSLVPIGNLE